MRRTFWERKNKGSFDLTPKELRKLEELDGKQLDITVALGNLRSEYLRNEEMLQIERRRVNSEGKILLQKSKRLMEFMRKKL